MKGSHRLRAHDRTFGPPLALRFPGPMLEEIDGIAARRFDQPDRSAVIRELLAEALEARRKASVNVGEPA
jgi:metal-responsive CopG/Arc/MetJ family transcriptional regulator